MALRACTRIAVAVAAAVRAARPASQPGACFARFASTSWSICSWYMYILAALQDHVADGLQIHGRDDQTQLAFLKDRALHPRQCVFVLGMMHYAAVLAVLCSHCPHATAIMVGAVAVVAMGQCSTKSIVHMCKSHVRRNPTMEMATMRMATMRQMARIRIPMVPRVAVIMASWCW